MSEIAPAYERRTCEPCGGTGERYDSTMADKAPTSRVECTRCRGRGFTMHLRPTAAQLAMQSQYADALAAPKGVEVDDADPAYDWLFGRA